MDERQKKSVGQKITTVHATCVTKDNQGLLLCGEPGIGKTELALSLLDRGFQWVADDMVLLYEKNSQLIASPVGESQGQCHLRDLGLCQLPQYQTQTVLSLCIDLLPQAPSCTSRWGVQNYGSHHLPRLSLGVNAQRPLAALCELAWQRIGKHIHIEPTLA